MITTKTMMATNTAMHTTTVGVIGLSSLMLAWTLDAPGWGRHAFSSTRCLVQPFGHRCEDHTVGEEQCGEKRSANDRSEIELISSIVCKQQRQQRHRPHNRE